MVGCGSSAIPNATKARNSHPAPRDLQPPRMWGTETPTQTPSLELNPGRRRRSPNASPCANRPSKHHAANIAHVQYLPLFMVLIIGAIHAVLFSSREVKRKLYGYFALYYLKIQPSTPPSAVRPLNPGLLQLVSIDIKRSPL